MYLLAMVVALYCQQQHVWWDWALLDTMVDIIYLKPIDVGTYLYDLGRTDVLHCVHHRFDKDSHKPMGVHVLNVALDLSIDCLS